MCVARRPFVSVAIAVTIFAGLMSSGRAAETDAERDYAQAIAEFKNAGALIGYSEENAKSSDGRQNVDEVRFMTHTEEEADAALASLRYLRSLPHPEDVMLSFCGFEAAHPQKLVQQVPTHSDVLSKLKDVLINIGPDFRVTDAEICELSKIPMVSALVIWSVEERRDVTDKGLACLEKLRGLRNLVLKRTRITDAGLVHLWGMKRLERLLLCDTEITGKGFRYHEGVPLRDLVLNGSKVNDENLKWLVKQERLERLLLGGCPIKGPGLKYLSQMKELRDLSLSGTQIDDKSLLHLEQSPKLEELWLYECAITDECVPALAKLSGLKKLGIGETKLTAAGREKLRMALPDAHIE